MALIKALYQKIIYSLRTKISRMQFMMVIATLVGLASGLGAVLLKSLVHFIQHHIEHIPISRFAYLFFPVLGLLMTVIIVQYFFRGHI